MNNEWGSLKYLYRYTRKIQGYLTLEFCFFPLWWKGNYSLLPQHLPQSFCDHSASFRDMHFTYNPSASFRDLVFLVFASATNSATTFSKVSGCGWFHFLSFWPFGPSFAFIFWLFFCYVRLSWAWNLRGHRQGAPLFGHVFLPRRFREASARLPRNTRSKTGNHKPTQHRIGVIWQQFIPKIKFQYGT